ncbi:adenylate/guanylate cyclase domain-containing protein [Allocoleopsis franciscana]|uniref:Family 3 adenylate cyclase n=1 Tax=Allocoleopsis franciscana PCC 7113 TaxID=1173027 RepID=K9WK01_9CYAN|nr:family 3 adenylate cyclase [Allocoleopsis franciscana PCC 7113]
MSAEGDESVPYLIQNPENPDQKVHELQFGLNTIGREISNTIILLHKSLSRHHAQLIINDQGVMMKDLGSLNKTYVNEREIDQCQLRHGDLVRCGSVLFKFVHSIEQHQAPIPLKDETANLSILRRFSPEQTRVEMQELLQQESSNYQRSVLKLRQEDVTQRAVDKLKILLEVSKQLSSPEENERLFEKILDLLFEIMNVDRAVILLVNEETGQLEQKAVKFRIGVPTDDQFYSTTITNFVQQNGDSVLISDARQDQRFSESLSVLNQAIQASMCVPLKPRDTVIGVLYTDNLSMADIYSQEDLEFLTALANQAAIAIENTELNKKMQSEAIVRTKLERFFPQAVSKKLKEEGNLEIVDTEVTALFADISGFTAMSSTMEPRQIIEMLNEYFEVMVEDIVFQYEGTLEKYIGDALLAVWGAPYRQPDDARRAVHAAIAMQRAVLRLREQWRQRHGIDIQIHIGLNTGKVAAGNIGSQNLIQYATIGDTTNVTSRICSAAQEGEIMISQTTLDQLNDPNVAIEKMPPVWVKGKDHPLQLYRVQWNV